MFSRSAIILCLAASASAQSAVWGQCGGIGWSGPTTCVANSHCVYSNDWYSQCLPGAASSAVVSSSVIVSSSTSAATSTLVSTVTSSGASTSTSTLATTTTGGGTPSTCSNIPTNLALTSYTPLPDPFTPISGSRITTKAQWTCRQNEINQLFQKYEMGTYPGKPQSVTASLSGTTLTINVSDNGKSISFTVSIKAPTSGTKPYPAIIAYGAASIPIPAGVAVITFNNDDIAAQANSASHGTGKFFTLYGSSASAGAITAWAWGVSRIIDALELTPAANINPLRIGVTGCSRNGKGAMGAGAFDARVRLTIPQESGSGGAGCWRISDWQLSQGINTQTASEIVGENAWFSPNFNAYATKVPTLPFDHHMLAGLIAPRPIFVIENRITWLGDVPCYGCMKAAQQIWTALGAADAFGFSQQGNHDHCSFPSAQQADLFAYINKYLLDQSATTGVFKSDTTFSSWNYAQWIPWSTPTLT